MTTPDDNRDPTPLEDDEGLSVLEISSIIQTQVYQLSGVIMPQVVVAAQLAVLAALVDPKNSETKWETEIMVYGLGPDDIKRRIKTALEGL